MVSVNVLEVVVAIAVCIPSAIVGLCFWFFQRHIEKRQAEADEKQAARQREADDREEKRKENEFITAKCLMASLELGEATAKAVERIPDCHCNGDMHAALDSVAEVKKEQKEFLEKEGIQAIYANQKNS